MNRTLQITIATAALSFALDMVATSRVGAQWPGNMGRRRDELQRQQEAMRRMSNTRTSRITSPGIMWGTLANQRPNDFFVDPDPIPNGQGGGGQGAGGQGNGGQGLGADGQRNGGNAGGQGGAGGNNNHPDHHHHPELWIGPARPLVYPRPLHIHSFKASVAAPPLNIIPEAGPTAALDILLTNPTKNGGEIRYTLNDRPYTMKSGYEQKLSTQPSWILKFDRGGSFGTVRYKLTPGTYDFAVTDRGWEVFRRVEATTPVPSVDESPIVAQSSP